MFHQSQPLHFPCNGARVTHCSLDLRDSSFVGHNQNLNTLEENNLLLDPTAPFEVSVEMFISITEIQIRSLFHSQWQYNVIGWSTSSFASQEFVKSHVNSNLVSVTAAAPPQCSLQPCEQERYIICVPLRWC